MFEWNNMQFVRKDGKRIGRIDLANIVTQLSFSGLSRTVSDPPSEIDLGYNVYAEAELKNASTVDVRLSPHRLGRNGLKGWMEHIGPGYVWKYSVTNN